MTKALPIAVSFLFATTLSAQVPNGMFQNLPIAVTFASIGAGATSTHYERVQMPSNATGMMQFEANLDGVRDYRITKIAQDLAASIGAPILYLEIDGFSTGNDQVPLDYEIATPALPERVQFWPVSTGQWASLLTAASSDSVGETGSLFEIQRAAVGGSGSVGVGTEVFTFYAHTENQFTAPYSGEIFMDMTNQFIDNYPSEVGTTPNLSSMDAFVPLLRTWTGGAIAEMPVLDRIFFSVTPRCATDMGISIGGVPVTAGTILTALWVSGKWESFSIAATPADLVRGSEDVNAFDIDALAVGMLPPSGTHTPSIDTNEWIFIFSHAPYAGVDPIPQLRCSADIDMTSVVDRRTLPIHQTGGGAIVDRIKGQSLDWNDQAVCIIDPEGNDALHIAGMPDQHALSTSELKYATYYNYHEKEFRGMVSGWPGTAQQFVLLSVLDQNLAIVGTPLLLGLTVDQSKAFSFSLPKPLGLEANSMITTVGNTPSLPIFHSHVSKLRWQ